MQLSLQSKHLRISAKVLYYFIMPMRDIISQSLFNPAVIVLHEVDALNRCNQSLAIYSITSVFLNFGLCYYVTNISGLELYDIFKIPPF